MHVWLEGMAIPECRHPAALALEFCRRYLAVSPDKRAVRRKLSADFLLDLTYTKGCICRLNTITRRILAQFSRCIRDGMLSDSSQSGFLAKVSVQQGRKRKQK